MRFLRFCAVVRLRVRACEGIQFTVNGTARSAEHNLQHRRDTYQALLSTPLHSNHPHPAHLITPMAALSDETLQATPVHTDTPKKPPPFMRFPTSESREVWLSQQRLSMAPQSRFIIGTTAATLIGMTLGVSQGAMMTGLRFRAENAHRLPASQTGWYLYHKSKNYHMMLGGLKEGLGMGLTQGVLVGAFIVLEEAVDQFRGGKRDFGSTVVAALGASGAFSLWSACKPVLLWYCRAGVLVALRAASLLWTCG